MTQIHKCICVMYRGDRPPGKTASTINTPHVRPIPSTVVDDSISLSVFSPTNVCVCFCLCTCPCSSNRYQLDLVRDQVHSATSLSIGQGNVFRGEENKDLRGKDGTFKKFQRDFLLSLSRTRRRTPICFRPRQVVRRKRQWTG